MFRILAVLFGIAFIYIGAAGFLPSVTSNAAFLSMLDISRMLGMVYIASGVLAIMAATGMKLTKLYFLLVGFVYIAGSIVGFVHNGDLMIMHVNTADNYFHLGIGIVSLLIGCYVYKRN